MSEEVESTAPPPQGEPAAPEREPAGFTVGQLTATAIDSFLSAAALHLGEPLPSGRTIAERDPVEAYLALVAASALLDQLGPVMNDDIKLPFQAGLSNLAKLFATTYPRVRVPRLPKPPALSLHANIQAAWDSLEAAEYTAAARPPATGALGHPGLGLPKSAGARLGGSGFFGGTGPLGKPGSGPLGPR